MQRTHGTNGELQCHMLNTLWEDNDATFVILNVDEIFVPFRVTDWRTKGSEDVLLTLQGVSSEQQASRFIGCEAYIVRTDLQEEIEEELDFTTLTGYTLCDAAKGVLGTITAIDTSTLNTLVELDSGVLLPLHEDFISDIDADNKRLNVHLPAGLV